MHPYGILLMHTLMNDGSTTTGIIRSMMQIILGNRDPRFRMTTSMAGIQIHGKDSYHTHICPDRIYIQEIQCI